MSKASYVTDDDEQEYLAIAKSLASARVQFSQAWQLARRRVTTDMAATQVAIEQTDDEITIIQAKLKIAEWRLHDS